MGEQTVLVPVESKHHPNQFKTLSLLRLFTRDGEPVFFVVEGSAILDGDDPLDASYFYNEHSCPTNYVPVEAIITPDDDDPHGIFEYVRSVWMPHTYNADDNEATIRALFPEVANHSSSAVDEPRSE